MKVKILWDDSYETPYIELPDEILKNLGWKVNDFITIDAPSTGGGLRIYKETDPITLMGGVKEVINGRA